MMSLTLFMISRILGRQLQDVIGFFIIHMVSIVCHIDIWELMIQKMEVLLRNSIRSKS